MNKFYTYIHTKKSTGEVFYVGKGFNNRYLAKDNRNKHWHNIVNKHGYDAQIVAYWDSEKETFDHEMLLISCFRDMGYKLANKTRGGEGSSGLIHSSETRSKISKKVSDYYADSNNKKLAIERAKKMAPITSKSIKLLHQDPEYKKRQSEGIKKAFSHPDAKIELSIRSKKSQNTPETLQKHYDNWKNEEIRNKRLDAQKMALSTPEARKIKSDRAKEMWAKPENKAKKIAYLKLRKLAADHYGVHYNFGGKYVDQYKKEVLKCH